MNSKLSVRALENYKILRMKYCFKVKGTYFFKRTEANNCPELQIDNLGGWPIYHQFNLSSHRTH